MYRLRNRLVPAVALALVLGGCGGGSERADDVVLAAGAGDRTSISGAGSAFVAPMLREWIARYRRAAPGVTIEYRPVGAAAGIQQLESGAVDFASSEQPLPEDRETTAGKPALLQVPWVAGGVAVAYNLPSLGELKLTGTTLAAIFAGRVSAWNDPLLRADNPAVTLPALPITVVHRSDPSATTQAFTEFLKGASDIWTVGSGATVRWPRGAGAEGPDALIAAVRQKAGSVGYVGHAHARDAQVGIASVRNGAGIFVTPTADAVNGAISGASPGSPSAYPITTVSYVAFQAAAVDPSRQAAVRHFVDWVLTEGQRAVELRHYAPIPHALLVDALATLRDPEHDREANGRRRR